MARKQNKKVVRKQRWQVPMPVLKWSLVGLVLSVLSVVVWWGGARLLDPNTLPIRKVQIQGHFQHLTTQRLQEAVSRQVGGGFFSVDVHGIQAAAQALPWVDTAAVRRVWPDTVRIRIEEQVPLSTWNETALLNRRGDVFTPPRAQFPADLPALFGSVGTQDMLLDNYLVLQETLQKLGLVVDVLARDERGAWQVDLGNGLRLRVGRGDYANRLKRFIAVYSSVLAPRLEQIESVDLRYTNGFALRWAQSQALVEPSAQEG